MRVTIDLNEEELRYVGQQIVGIADSVEGDENELERVVLQINTAAVLAERVMEWVTHAKSQLARQGVAA